MICATLTQMMSQSDTASFSVQIGADTILFGNTVEVRFTLKNLDGRFEAPSFKDFTVLGVPNQQSQMSIVNGVTNKTVSYSYFIKPNSTGTAYLEPAYVSRDGEASLETKPVEITCVPNPDGIVQESRISNQTHETFGFGDFPLFRERQKPKKKLKVTKI